ncbi:ribonucleotide-diphosphate reductase [Ktedonobacter sp. SOSP1-85]|uniref:ribonucleotide-diphosphate reductase n=1 Tax=Ktedonobacter sp. SOSP1-85 TaxID=2778367 RepID=UPI0019158634|nr:ribonucleotide-diphosphate reductase [Ktedonobacter sp. SOSP1-85]GHO73489.1 ribonucleotide-diphosphate reductase [Ktedonobacter sp. SOSP1-85]
MAQRTYVTLSNRGLNHDILPMKLYQKAKKLGIWNPRDIDLTLDIEHWQHTPGVYKETLSCIIFDFQAGEEAVTLDLLPLVMTMAREGRLEEELFLTTFLWEEAKHTEFVRRILDEVLQEHGDLHEYHTLNAARDLFRDDLPQDMNRLLTDPSPANQVRASVTYNMIVEGVLAETGYYSLLRMLDLIENILVETDDGPFSKMLASTNFMPGLRQGLRLFQRDESRHIAYGVFLISRLIAQDPSLWSVAEAHMKKHFASIESNQSQNGTSEAIRAYTRQQFQKRLARLAQAREQSLEQICLADVGEGEKFLGSL